MSINPETPVKESDTVVKKELHTKCVPPKALTKALRELLGDAEFKVEVRNGLSITRIILASSQSL
jgi:hypothetical protein